MDSREVGNYLSTDSENKPIYTCDKYANFNAISTQFLRIPATTTTTTGVGKFSLWNNSL
jgi:hypothetical protein